MSATEVVSVRVPAVHDGHVPYRAYAVRFDGDEVDHAAVAAREVAKLLPKKLNAFGELRFWGLCRGIAIERFPLRMAWFMAQLQPEQVADIRHASDLLDRGIRVFDAHDGDIDKIRARTSADGAVWEGRVITTSKYPSLPIRCTWVATGNNLTLSDEIARRTFMIELASTVERPDLRPPGSFRHADLLGWVRENRAHLLTSALEPTR